MAAKRPAARQATSGTVAAQLMDAKKPRAKRGVKAGLKDGETRVTCVLTDDQSQVLHDWAKTNNRTFREITMAMADRYIAEVIKPYADEGHKLRRQAGVEPPASYADFYEGGAADDMLDKYDTYAR